MADVLALAEQGRDQKALAMVKAAVDVGTLTGAGFVDDYAFTMSSEAFVESLATISAFDAIAPYARELPLRTRAFVASQASAAEVGEARPKILSEISFEAGGLEPVKVAGLVVITDDLLRRAGQAIFANELRAAVSRATNSVFVNLLIDTSTPSVTGTGDFLADLASAVVQTSPNARSRFFLLADPLTVARLALASDSTTGERLYPELTVMGGSIAGVEVMPTDAIVADSSGANLLLIDAQQIAVGSDTLVVSAAQQATVEMDSAPDHPTTASTVLVSLWQRNLLGLRAERFIAARKLRDTAVVQIADTNYAEAA
jgi:hypothetical protein